MTGTLLISNMSLQKLFGLSIPSILHPRAVPSPPPPPPARGRTTGALAGEEPKNRMTGDREEGRSQPWVKRCSAPTETTRGRGAERGPGRDGDHDRLHRSSFTFWEE